MEEEIKEIEDWDTTGISEQLSEELKQKLAKIVAGIVLDYQRKWQEELDLIYWRIGHQIRIHRNWLLKQTEEDIIKFVKASGEQVRKKLK